MINFLKNQFNSEFAKNVLTLATGTTLAQAIPIAISPILTRIYSPEDFGIFAIFLSCSAILGSLVNAKYEMAIMLPHRRQEAVDVFKLTCLISVSISVFVFIILLFSKHKLVILLGEPKLEPWLLILPISIFLIGLFNSLTILNVREKKYEIVSISAVSKSASLSFTQILFGTIKSSSGGLILGQIMSYIIANVVLIIETLKKNVVHKKISVNQLIFLLKKYVKFPTLSLPAVLLNSSALNSTNLFISSFYDIKTVGFYSLANRILGAPSAVLGNSISKVFFQQAAAEIQVGKGMKDVFIRTLIKLSFIAFPIFFAMYFIVEPVFEIVFGLEWRIAGEYAKILVPFMFVRFVSSSLSNTFDIKEKQEFFLLFNVLLFGGQMLLFTLFTDLDFISILNRLAWLNSILYLIMLAMAWALVYKEEQE